MRRAGRVVSVSCAALLFGDTTVSASSSSMTCLRQFMAPTSVGLAPKKKVAVTKPATPPKKAKCGKKVAPPPTEATPLFPVPTAPPPPSTPSPRDNHVELLMYVNERLSKEISAIAATVPGGKTISFLVAEHLSDYRHLPQEEGGSIAYSLVPTLLIKRSVTADAYQRLFTSTAMIRTTEQADSFVEAAIRHCHRALNTSAVSTSKAPIQGPMFGGAEADLKNLLSAAKPSATTTADATAASAPSTNKSTVALNLDLGSLKGSTPTTKEDVSPEVTTTSQEDVVAPSSAPAIRDTEDSPTDDVPAALRWLKRISDMHYISNLYYFKNDRIQVMQNKKQSVLYKQIGALRQRINNGLVSVRIMPVSSPHAKPLLEASGYYDGDKKHTSYVSPSSHLVAIEMLPKDVLDALDVDNNLTSYGALELANEEVLAHRGIYPSANRRLFCKVSTPGQGSLGTLLEMLRGLLDAFGIAVAAYLPDKSISEHSEVKMEDHAHDYFVGAPTILRKVESNVMRHQTRNLAEIIIRHYFGGFLNVNCNFMVSQTRYKATVTIDIAGYDGSETTNANFKDISDGSGEASFQDGPKVAEGEGVGPLDRFPPIVLGSGLGFSKKQAAEAACMDLIRKNFLPEVSRSVTSLDVKPIPFPTPGGARFVTNLSVTDGYLAPYYEGLKLSPEALAENPHLRLPLGEFIPESNATTFNQTVSHHLPLEERAVAALQGVLHRKYPGVGFSIQSYYEEATDAELSEVSAGDDGTRFVLKGHTEDGEDSEPAKLRIWRSEVVLNNATKAVLGTGLSHGRLASKHTAVLRALTEVSPEEAAEFKGAEVPVPAPSSSAQGGDERPFEEGDLVTDDYRPAPDQGGWEVTSMSSNASVRAGSPQGVTGRPLTPANSVLSRYRRALQIQLERGVECAVDPDADSDVLDMLPEPNPLREVLQVAMRLRNEQGAEAPDEWEIKEMTETADPAPGTASALPSVQATKTVICVLYAVPVGTTKRNATMDDLNSHPWAVRLTPNVTAHFYRSEMVAKLAAYSTAYASCVKDSSIVDETEDGLSSHPAVSLRNPSVAGVAQVVMHCTGGVLSMMRQTDATGITFASAQLAHGSGPSRTVDRLTYGSSSHPDAAQRMALLETLRILWAAKEGYSLEGSPTPASNPTTPNDEFTASDDVTATSDGAVVSGPPPVVVVVPVSSDPEYVDGYLCKALSVIRYEEREALGSTDTFTTLLCIKGVADPKRLTLLWNDRILSSAGGLTANHGAGERYTNQLHKMAAELLGQTVKSMEKESAPMEIMESVARLREAVDPAKTLQLSLHFLPPGGAANEWVLPPAAVSVESVGLEKGLFELVQVFASKRADHVRSVLAAQNSLGSATDQEVAFKEAVSARLKILREEHTHLDLSGGSTLNVTSHLKAEEGSMPCAAESSASTTNPLNPVLIRSRQMPMKGHLEALIYAVLGCHVDTMYAQSPTAMTSDFISSPSKWGYSAGTTEIAGVVDGDGGLLSGPASSRSWFCVLGVRTGADENTSSTERLRALSVDLPTERVVVDLGGGGDSLVPLCMLPAAGQMRNLQPHDMSKWSMGGSVSNINGFLVIGVGAAATKREAMTAAVTHAMQWHFPSELDQLNRLGIS